MPATMIERMTENGDYSEDGGSLDVPYVHYGLILYEANLVDAAWLKTQWACTGQAQEEQVDELLATMPTALLLVVNAVQRARWPNVVASTVFAGKMRYPGFETAAEVETALGL